MPLRFRLEDLSPAQQEQVKRQLSPTRQVQHRKTPADSPPSARQKLAKRTAPKAALVDVGRFQDPVEDLRLVDFDTSNSSFSAPTAQNLRKEQMSSAEKAYLRDVLHGNGLFEAITLKSPSGNRYTPDILTVMDGVNTLIEVKDRYRLESEGRAHTAFMEAASNFSSIFQFLWVKREKGGKWTTKIAIPRTQLSSSSPTRSQ